MYSDNKQIRDVADVAAKIMYGQQPVTENLHPNQQQWTVTVGTKTGGTSHTMTFTGTKEQAIKKAVARFGTSKNPVVNAVPAKQGVAEGSEQQLDVHEPEKDELTADDFKKLRGKKEVKKEEVEELDELSKDTLGSYIKKANFAGGMADFKHGRIADKRGDSKEKTSLAATSHKRTKGISTAVDKLSKEEVESIDEVKMADLPSTKVQGRSYGASKPEPHAVDTLSGPKEKELKDIDAEKKKKKFSEMVNLYQEKGLKSLSEMLVKEEPDNEQFTKELEDAKAKDAGKKKNTEIAKGSVQAVKQEELDINDINGVQMSTIEERHMTDGEMDKRETIVKSMKKGMAGFKDRYGDRAKNVMYATANKQAMKD